MSFMSSIITACNNASSWFYSLYLDSYSGGWPLSSLADWFYQLCLLFNNLAWYFYDFSSWVNSVGSQLSQILSWNTIWSYILNNVPNLTKIRDWFYSWYANVTSTVNTWWSTTQYTVQAWVQGAKDQATALFNQANAWLANLQAQVNDLIGQIPNLDELVAWWGDWWGNVLTQLGTWWNSRLAEVNDLVNSAFLSRESFWSGWQDMKSQVIEFFTDPVGFIWHRFADWFLGPE